MKPLLLSLLLLSGCSRAVAREPALDLTPTLAELDRLHEAIWPLEVEVCLRRAGGRCLR